MEGLKRQGSWGFDVLGAVKGVVVGASDAVQRMVGLGGDDKKRGSRLSANAMGPPAAKRSPGQSPLPASIPEEDEVEPLPQADAGASEGKQEGREGVDIVHLPELLFHATSSFFSQSTSHLFGDQGAEEEGQESTLLSLSALIEEPVLDPLVEHVVDAVVSVQAPEEGDAPHSTLLAIAIESCFATNSEHVQQTLEVVGNTLITVSNLLDERGRMAIVTPNSVAGPWAMDAAGRVALVQALGAANIALRSRPEKARDPASSWQLLERLVEFHSGHGVREGDMARLLFVTDGEFRDDAPPPASTVRALRSLPAGTVVDVLGFSLDRVQTGLVEVARHGKGMFHSAPVPDAMARGIVDSLGASVSCQCYDVVLKAQATNGVEILGARDLLVAEANGACVVANLRQLSLGQSFSLLLSLRVPPRPEGDAPQALVQVSLAFRQCGSTALQRASCVLEAPRAALAAEPAPIYRGAAVEHERLRLLVVETLGSLEPSTAVARLQDLQGQLEASRARRDPTVLAMVAEIELEREELREVFEGRGGEQRQGAAAPQRPWRNRLASVREHLAQQRPGGFAGDCSGTPWREAEGVQELFGRARSVSEAPSRVQSWAFKTL